MLRRVWVAGALLAVALVSGCGSGSSSTADAARPDPTPSKASHSTAPVNPSRAKLAAYAAAVERATASSVGPALKAKFSSIRVEPVSPSGINYVYTFKQAVDVGQSTATLEKQVPLLDTAFRTEVKPEMERLGFDHPSATFTYLNPDGSAVWSHTSS